MSDCSNVRVFIVIKKNINSNMTTFLFQKYHHYHVFLHNEIIKQIPKTRRFINKNNDVVN